MSRERVALSGVAVVTLSDALGDVIQVVTSTNLVLDNGLNMLIQLGAGSAAGGPATPLLPIGFMAVGTSGATPAHADPDQGSELSPRKPVTAAWQAPGSIRFSANWAATEAVGTISTVGLWTAATGGAIFSKLLLPTAIAKLSTTPLEVNYTITMSAS